MKRIIPLLLILVLLITCLPLTVLATSTSYSYNGTVLPDINSVWNKEIYPYAYIADWSGGYSSTAKYWVIFIQKKLWFYEEEALYSTGLVSNFDAAFYYYDGTQWVYNNTLSGIERSNSGNANNPVLWASIDILNINDDTVYLAASDPVAVGGDSSTDFTDPTEPESSGTIISITVDCDDSADIYPGDTVQFWANVNGNGTYDTSVTWSFATGGTDSTTTLDQNGLLTIGKHENSLYLAVTATSVADPTISGTRSIKLNLSGSPESTESTEPTDDPPGSSGTDYSDQFADVNQNLEDVENAVGEVGDAVDAVGDKVDDIISGGEAGSDLTDKSGQLGDDLGDINDFEQSQKDVLDNSMEDLKSSVSFTDFIPAMSFVQTYINRAWAGVPSVWVLYTVPLFLGLFFYICSRMPGVTRWRAAPPPKASKKKE